MEESKSIISHNLEHKFEPKSIFIQSHPFLNQSSKKIYQRVLAFSQLKLHHQISYRNVKIYQNQYIHQIYNIHPQKSQIPHLVFLHGFGGTSMTSIKLYKHLHNHFQIHALDCYGMGYSSRGNFRHNFSAQETKNYYINAIQEWRKTLNINSFILVGHSFGGYLATCYSQMYPQKVDRLMLLSPAGFSSELRNTNQQETSFRQKFFYCLAQKIYNMNIRPSSAISSFLIGNRILNAILSNRLKLMDQQKEAWKEYFKHFTSQQKNSQVGFYRLFQWPLQPVESIEAIIKRNNFKFKIDFFYGDSDWMRRNGIQKLLKNYKNTSLTIIPNAGHQMVFDNPIGVANRIIDQVL